MLNVDATRCSKCKTIVGRKEIKMDHIHPVIRPEIGFESWDIYISRMFPDESGWQALCDICHKEKTKLEKQTKKLTIKKKRSRI